LKLIGAAFALRMGLSVSDAVRILLTCTANEGALPLELIGNAVAQDARFRGKV
jgi:DNA-damage-inducible protein J